MERGQVGLMRRKSWVERETKSEETGKRKGEKEEADLEV